MSNYYTRGYIKNIELELPEYAFNHSDSVINESSWVNRTTTETLLYELLTENRPTNQNEQPAFHGIYLVTGYRGTGKSSLVNWVIKKIKQDQIENKSAITEDIKISLSQTKLSEKDIYRQLISQCVLKIQNRKIECKKVNKDRWFSFPDFLGHNNDSFSGILLYPFINFLDVRFDTLSEFDRKNSSTFWIDFFIKSVIGILSVIAFTSIMSLLAISLLKEFTYQVYANCIWETLCYFYLDHRLLVLGVILGTSSLMLGIRYRIFEKIKADNKSIISAYTRLQELHLRLDSNMEEEGQQGTSAYLSMYRRKKVYYTSGNPKELQSELIFQINELSNHGINFCFIFDELDKLEDSREKINLFKYLENKESDETSLMPDEEMRTRKQKIMSIIGSMKYFLNACPGKFVFIAGREMFDAALADVSDRNNSIGSIFHSTIYVDSFLKDNDNSKRKKGISGMTEEFLEKRLLPRESINHNPDDSFLKKYNKFLEGITSIERLDRLKIIYSLQQFIVYLVYRGNGSPKKINKIIDSMLKFDNVSQEQISFDPHRTIRVNQPARSAQIPANKSRKYLRISFSNQYRFGLINYIYRPYLITNSKITRALTDQNLVHTPFLFDHLIKFHPFAFSRKDLELLPEVMASNRTPEIRYHLNDLLQWMSFNLIRETEVGFFEYKFFHKIYNELSYITKLFEEESAAFNFTLDESHAVKLSIRIRIKELRSVYKGFNSGGTLHSLSFLNSLLGDAHMLDQEYPDAIVAYQDCLYALEQNTLSPNENLLITLRVRMKMALCFERMQAFEPAQNEYIKVTKTSGDLHSLKLSKLDHIASFSKYHILSLLCRLFLKEKSSHTSVGFEDIKWFCEEYNKNIQYYSGKNQLEFKWCLLHLGLLLFYKNNSRDAFSINTIKNGRNHDLILFLDKSKEICTIKLHKYLNFDNPKSISKDFKVPEACAILYISLLEDFSDSKFTPSQQSPYSGFGNQSKTSDIWKLLEKYNSNLINNTYSYSKEEMSYIASLLSKLGDTLLSYGNFMSSEDDTRHQLNTSATPFSATYNNVTGSSDQQKLINALIHKYISSNSSELVSRNQYHLELVICTLLVASEYYLKFGRSVSASFQLRKIINIVRTTIKSPDANPSFFENIENLLISRILRISSWNSGSSDRPQIYKYKEIFEIHTVRHPEEYTRFNYLNISNSSELKEGIYQYAGFKLRSYDLSTCVSLTDCLKKIPEAGMINNTNSITVQFARLNELSLMYDINRKIMNDYLDNISGTLLADWKKNTYNQYKKLTKDYREELIARLKKNSQISANEESEEYPIGLNEKHISILPIYRNILKAIQVLHTNQTVIDKPFDEKIKFIKNKIVEINDVVSNSIYVLNSMITIYSSIGIGFLPGYSALADTQRRLGDMLKLLELSRILEEILDVKKEERIDNRLDFLIGKSVVSGMDTTSLHQSAILNYYKSIQFHHGGTPYKELISHLIFLEDDFNDHLYHYGVAFERMQVNSGSVRIKINKLVSEIKESQVTTYESYVPENDNWVGEEKNSQS